jgi:hypothetical protein
MSVGLRAACYGSSQVPTSYGRSLRCDRDVIWLKFLEKEDDATVNIYQREILISKEGIISCLIRGSLNYCAQNHFYALIEALSKARFAFVSVK